MNAKIDDLIELPKEVQVDVANHLINYSEVNVTREFGRYSCFNGSCLSCYYAPDHKVWTFNKKTVMQVPELADIIAKGEEEEEKWYREHGNEVNWDFMMS